MQRAQDNCWVLYYRNVTQDIVGIWTGQYSALRQMELEIRLKDPGNYLAIHCLPIITQDNVKEEIEKVLKEFND